jgi:2-amino-4-hydroxy-6-hydroxymethyldihydropteridine diphosphokinase/dihydropteroate synthase
MRVSVVFETTALLTDKAPVDWDIPYLNLVVLGVSEQSPHTLLKKLKEIETLMGRDQQAARWSPRVIDLDILAYGDQIVSTEILTLPHPELLNRPFFLRQMAELDPEWVHPTSHLTLTEMLHSQTTFDPSQTRCFASSTQFVGIVNVTPDSFSDGGKYLHIDQAIKRIEELINQGAAVIDIGAQSTRPSALSLTADDEWDRLKPVFEYLAQDFTPKRSKPQISLDSFYPEVIEKALEYYPIDWVNDVSGTNNLHLLEIVKSHPLKLVLTHSVTVPASPNHVIEFDTSPIKIVYEWAKDKLEKLHAINIPKEKIILDPGIGFGKTQLQSVSLLRNCHLLKTLGCEILVGHSRKSYLKLLTTSPDRDFETVGSSLYLAEKGIDYLRVHNVEAHQKTLTAFQLLKGSS